MPWPQGLEIEGVPGNFEAVLRHASQIDHIKAGAVILALGDVDEEALTANSAIPVGSLLSRILSRERWQSGKAEIGSALLTGFSIKETAGIFTISSDTAESPETNLTLPWVK